MSLIYPNTVPENNLRLPDALTIEHGPAGLLAKFVIEGDKAARRMGLRLRLRHDFDELVRLNQLEVSRGNWFRLINMFNPELSDVSPENAFWVSGETPNGEIAVTWAGRIYYWPDSNLAEEACAMFYGRDDGQQCAVTAPVAQSIIGVVLSAGSVWVRPEFRGKQLSRLFPRIGRAYACSRWPVDWTISYVAPILVEKGVAAGQCCNLVIAGLPGAGHRLVKFGNPTSKFFVRLVLDLFANAHYMVALTQPVVLVADKSEYRVLFTRLNADDHHSRKQLVLDGKRDDARIEMTKRHPPFLRERAQPTLFTVE